MCPLSCICVSVGLRQQDSDCVLLWEKGLMIILKRREKKLQLMAFSQQTDTEKPLKTSTNLKMTVKRRKSAKDRNQSLYNKVLNAVREV